MGGTRTVSAALAIAGQAADESGVRSVEVSVRYAGTGKAAKKKKRNRLPRGTYEIRVRATDLAGNASDAPNAAARTLVTFRIV